MRIWGMLTAIAAAAMLSGCVTESSYKQAQEIVRGSPAMKRDAINECYRGASRASPARKAQMAKIMNVSPRSNVARTYCTRAFNGIASGRISYEDFRIRSPRFIRVIQGR
ncbi:hypothetical protein [Aquamicrobium defluvii]|uniref:Lipoprotein n=1 Tax=Aquamicrobium defluvii TaxID=69279 RepID=A0A011USN5_9HYPH|nr:hypothetical protein [Aquamicrobium defluvii]EXL09271.1 hypothetical protein BG36_23345 [Aquamicrobium defluvii]EZQ17811.1 hypothetical protein CF98_31320 [Halopseudomonas bauzanensis]TDR37640.1 hypothetical protein DES43_102188 [Aquamicrobium defluvii]